MHHYNKRPYSEADPPNNTGDVSPQTQGCRELTRHKQKINCPSWLTPIISLSTLHLHMMYL